MYHLKSIQYGQPPASMQRSEVVSPSEIVYESIARVSIKVITYQRFVKKQTKALNGREQSKGAIKGCNQRVSFNKLENSPFHWLGLLKWSLAYSDGTEPAGDVEPMSKEDIDFLEKVMKEGIMYHR